MKRVVVPITIAAALCYFAGSAASARLPQQPAPAAPAAAKLELMGQFGGLPRDVAVAGDLAYLSVGARVWAMDVSDPAAPRLVGISPTLPGLVGTVRTVASGVVALFSDPDAGGATSLALLGPPDGRALKLVGQVKLVLTQVSAMAVDGTRVIIIGREFVPSRDFTAWLVDLSQPEDLTARQLPWPEGYNVIAPWSAVFVAQRYLYVLGANQDDGSPLLEILDLSEPDRPLAAGTAALRGAVPVVLGSVLYLLDESAQREPMLRLVDVADPIRPRLLSSVMLAPTRYGLPTALTVASGYAFVLDQFGEITAYDVSDPATPLLLGTPTGNRPVATGVAVGRRLYLATLGAPDELPGLRVMDINLPTGLQDLGHLAVLPSDVRGIAVADSHAYVTAASPTYDDAKGGLWDLDISDPANPWPVAHIDRPVGCSRLAREGRFLYASGSVYCPRSGISAFGTDNGPAAARQDPAVEPGLDIVDISVPGVPRLRGSHPEGANSRRFLAAGAGRVYVAPGWENKPEWLLSIDVSDPDQPRVVGRMSEPDFPLKPAAVTARGSRLFGLGFNVGGFATLDARRPEALRVIRRDGDVWGQDLAADERHAIYVGDGAHVYDVSSLSGMRLLGTIAKDTAEVVALSGDIAWVGHEGLELSGSDLSGLDLGSGFADLVATTTLPAYADSGRSETFTALTANQDLVLAGAGEAGLFIYRLVDPDRPQPTPSPSPSPTGGPPNPAPVFLPIALHSGHVRDRTGTLTEIGAFPGRYRGLAHMGSGEVVLALQQEPGAGGTEYRVVALDFSRPDTPRVVGRSEPLPDSLDAYSLAVRAGVAYVPSFDGLTLVDVQDLARPHVLGKTFLQGVWHGLTLDGSRGYLFGPGELRFLDLTDSAVPRTLGTFTLQGDLAGSYIKYVAAHDNILVLAIRPNGPAVPGLVVVDVQDLARPKIVAQAFYGQDIATVRTDGRLAYVSPARDADDGVYISGGLVVLDITEPERLRELGFRLDQELEEIMALAQLEPDVMLLGGEEGLKMWDVSNTHFPREITVLDGPSDGSSESYSLVVGEGTAYVGTEGGISAFRWSVDP